MTTTGTAHGCPVNESFDPLAPDFLAAPFTVMAALPGDERPVFFAPSIGYYVLTRYADIEQVFGDPATYSAAVAQAPLVPLVPEAQRILLAGGHQPQPSMVSLDEPEHARLRKPAARAFSMKRGGDPPLRPVRAGLATGHHPAGHAGRTCSTCGGPTPDVTWRSGRACTTAWARTSGSWKPRSRWPHSPAASPGCGLSRISGSRSIPTSRSEDRRS